MKQRLDDQIRDKKLMEEDLYISRDKLKEILREKLALQNEFHTYERQASQRLDEYQYSITTICSELQEVSDDNQKLKIKISEQDTEVSALERARDNFKAQFLELREINKDLRVQFNNIQAQMQSYMQNKQTEKIIQSDDKENQKTVLVMELQNMIRDYKRNTSEKRGQRDNSQGSKSHLGFY